MSAKSACRKNPRVGVVGVNVDRGCSSRECDGREGASAVVRCSENDEERISGGAHSPMLAGREPGFAVGRNISTSVHSRREGTVACGISGWAVGASDRRWECRFLRAADRVAGALGQLVRECLSEVRQLIGEAGRLIEVEVASVAGESRVADVDDLPVRRCFDVDDKIDASAIGAVCVATTEDHLTPSFGGAGLAGRESEWG